MCGTCKSIGPVVGCLDTCNCICHSYKLKLELGKTYVDGNDRKVRIICLDKLGPSPVVGLMLLKETNEICFYSIDGVSAYRSSGCNLVKEYKEPRFVWINLWDRDHYPDGKVIETKASTGFYHKDRVAADFQNVRHANLMRIAVIKLNLDTGEVVNEPLIEPIW